jgi:hypothetical protein
MNNAVAIDIVAAISTTFVRLVIEATRAKEIFSYTCRYVKINLRFHNFAITFQPPTGNPSTGRAGEFNLCYVNTFRG